jgi:hypothetical protein
VFVPFNSQPRYQDKISHELKKNRKKGPKVVQHQPKKEEKSNNKTTIVAERYSEVYDGAEYDDRKGLAVFQRYCHMYREGEFDSHVSEIDSLEILETGFETGNHFMILKVI